MPHKPKRPPTNAGVNPQVLWYQVNDAIDVYGLSDWDPDTAAVTQALLDLTGAGLTVVLRPGSGGRALGVAIWQGENRPPAKWFGDQDEFNAWARGIVEAAAKERERKQAEGA